MSPFSDLAPDGDGSNRTSYFIRRLIEALPFKQILGINLAGIAFAAAIVGPQTSELTTSLRVLAQTQQTIIEMPPTQTNFQWPMNRFGFSQGFSLFHPGVDLTAPQGTALFPVSDGKVAWTTASPWGYGKHLLVEHDNGIKSLYAHLSYVKVSDGALVSKNTQLGEIGSTGWATGNHLHLEIYQDGTPVNPLEVLPELKH